MSQPEIVERIKYETSTAFRIDESKRPKNEGPVESFRKLNVDWMTGNRWRNVDRDFYFVVNEST